MIEAVLFNWSGTLSDYGGRGREAWYQPLAARRPALLVSPHIGPNTQAPSAR